MEFPNHFLREALCAFRFEVEAEQTELPLEYCLRFYNALKPDGFTAQQQQPFQLAFEVSDNALPESVKPELTKGTPSLILRNESTGYAIIIGEGLLSFNCLKLYPGWSVFMAELVARYLPIYHDLGIKQRLQAAQMAYINEFILEPGEAASDYLAYLPQLSEVTGAIAAGHTSVSQFLVPPTTAVAVQTRVLVGEPDTLTRVVLECNATTRATVGEDAYAVANTAHAAARAAFMSVATPHYKASIA